MVGHGFRFWIRPSSSRLGEFELRYDVTLGTAELVIARPGEGPARAMAACLVNGLTAAQLRASQFVHVLPEDPDGRSPRHGYVLRTLPDQDLVTMETDLWWELFPAVDSGFRCLVRKVGVRGESFSAEDERRFKQRIAVSLGQALRSPSRPPVAVEEIPIVTLALMQNTLSEPPELRSAVVDLGGLDERIEAADLDEDGPLPVGDLPFDPVFVMESGPAGSEGVVRLEEDPRGGPYDVGARPRGAASLLRRPPAAEPADEAGVVRAAEAEVVELEVTDPGGPFRKSAGAEAPPATLVRHMRRRQTANEVELERLRRELEGARRRIELLEAELGRRGGLPPSLVRR